MKEKQGCRSVAAILVAIMLITASSGEAAQLKVVTPEELWALFVKKPAPIYPYEARRSRITGTGLFRMYVNPDGSVRAVGVMKSTGHQMLDLAASAGLYRARLKPARRPREVDIPVTFTMTG